MCCASPVAVLEVAQLTPWLWRPATPVVAMYALRQGDGFNLIDMGTAGAERAILECLAESGAVRADQSARSSGPAGAYRRSTGRRRRARLGAAGDGRRCARAHPGSIAAVFAQDRVLVAGDAIASHDGRPMLGVFNADPAQARSSFQRLPGLDVDLACFGHGDPLLSGAHDALERVASEL